MGNPLFDMYANAGNMPMQSPTNMISGMRFANPMQKMGYIMQAMTNPAAFVRSVFPNMPNEISNNPNQILQWMQQTQGVTQQDIRNAENQLPR